MLLKENAILVVVDIQDILMPKDKEVVDSYLRNAKKMILAAKALTIPVLVTEQNPERLGTTNAEILAALGETPRISKIEFGCLANLHFYETLCQLQRRELIIIGMETHVCVMQTALQAIEQGFDAYIVCDAVVSARKGDYKAGLARMQQEGVRLACTEMVIFEWLRKAGTPEFKSILPLIKS